MRFRHAGELECGHRVAALPSAARAVPGDDSPHGFLDCVTRRGNKPPGRNGQCRALSPQDLLDGRQSEVGNDLGDLRT